MLRFSSGGWNPVDFVLREKGGQVLFATDAGGSPTSVGADRPTTSNCQLSTKEKARMSGLFLDHEQKT